MTVELFGRWPIARRWAQVSGYNAVSQEDCL